MNLRRFAGKVHARLLGPRPRPVILMYHRVAVLRSDPWSLAVPPERFHEQMAYLHANRSPMPMRQLVQRLLAGDLPPNAVGVTFDDGYLDNLVNAKPILEQFRIPATVFIATGFVGQDAPYWWDELAGLILGAGDPLDREQICAGQPVRLAWGSVERSDTDCDWRGWDPPQTARQRCYVEVWSKLQSATPAEREQVLQALRAVLKAPSDPLGIPMSAQQIRELISGGLLSVEAHTTTHRALTDLTREESRREMRESQEQCGIFAEAPVEGLAYPYGNFDPQVCEDLHHTRLSWACTTEELFLDGRTPDLTALPRRGVSNVPLQRFASMLTG